MLLASAVLITAQQAREQAERIQTTKLEAEFRKFGEVIQKAVNNGDMFCNVKGVLSHTVKEELQKIGYTVEDCGDSISTSYARVSW